MAHRLLTHPGTALHMTHADQKVHASDRNHYLRSLVAMNKHLYLIAHAPLQTLLKSGEQCWSLAELVQAVVILAHCHSLCSFVFGCDTTSDLVPLSKSPNGTPPTFCPFDAANGNTNVPQSLATPPEHITRRRVRRHETLPLFTFWNI